MPQAQSPDDQDFQPNKRARIQIQLERAGLHGSAHITAEQTPCLPYARTSAGKENVPPLSSLGAAEQPGVPITQAKANNEEADADTLPLRKAKALLPATATMSASDMAPTSSQPAKAPVAVRAFFTRRGSWQSHQPFTADAQPCMHSNQTTQQLLHKQRCLASPQVTPQVRPQVSPRSAQCTPKPTQASAQPDQATGRPKPVTGKPVSLPGDFVCLDSSDSESASDDGELAEMQTQAEQSQHAVSAWLQQHGLAAYIAAFQQAEVRPTFNSDLQ